MFHDNFFIQNLFDFFQNNVGKKWFPKSVGLDSQPCLSQSLVYTCCPYIGELKVILSQYLTGIKVSRY
jgi:hypothetical protein